jgi:hypothetical protein
MGSGAAKAFPTPGVAGNGLGNLAIQPMQAPSQQPNMQPMQPLQAATALKPMTPSMGRVLQKGQAAFPVAQTPMNPWGVNRGGGGALPLYRRPGTMPEAASTS